MCQLWHKFKKNEVLTYRLIGIDKRLLDYFDYLGCIIYLEFSFFYMVHLKYKQTIIVKPRLEPKVPEKPIELGKSETFCLQPIRTR